MGPTLVGKDVVYKQVLTDPGMFSIIYGGASGAMQSFHRRGMKQDENAQDHRLCEDTGPNDGISSSWIVRLRCRRIAGIIGRKTLACPCCNGPLTADKLARLLSDVQRPRGGCERSTALCFEWRWPACGHDH